MNSWPNQKAEIKRKESPNINSSFKEKKTFLMYKSQKINTVKNRIKNPTGPFVITAKPIRHPENNAEIHRSRFFLLEIQFARK